MKILILLSLFILVGCKGGGKTEPEKTTIFVPGAPGGDIGTGSTLQKLMNLTVSVDAQGNHVLNWVTPATYIGREYEIFLYRVKGDGVTAQLPDPSEPYNTAFLYFVRPGFTALANGQNTYTDITYLAADTTYTYYAYVRSGNNWSEGIKNTITIPSTTTSINIPTATTFWPNYRQSFGSKPLAGASIFLNTLSPGIPTIGNPTGECAFGADGGVMYCADTDNNRVMIYVSQSYASCKGYDKDSIDYEICQAVFSGYPLSPVAVLGQKSFDTSHSCGEASNPLGVESCMTKPRSVLVAEGRLLVSDSGNDRITIYENLPVFGCYHYLNMSGEITPDECHPYKVIGKKGLLDNTTYTITEGLSSLKNPSGMAYKNSDLYIADTGNHRVVLVKSVFDDEVNQCESGTWQTSKCRFNAVLGQPNFTSKEKFSDEYASLNILYNPVTSRLNDDGYFLERHFANPTKILINGTGLVIISNENFSDNLSNPNLALYGRIAVFDIDPIGGNTPICNSGNFNGSACAANYIIGQTNPYNLVELDSLQVYGDIPYTLKDVDAAILSTNLIAVEKSTNSVLVWFDFTNTTPGSGVPYLYRVLNPAGAYDTNTNRNLPNLQNLSSIAIVGSTGNAYITDSGLGKVFEIPLKK